MTSSNGTTSLPASRLISTIVQSLNEHGSFNQSIQCSN